MKVYRTNVILSILWFAFVFLCSFVTSYAAQDQFNINLSVTAGVDTIAPSLPTALTATAVSSSQIDLGWTASTDNVAVTGYRVYRDNSLVATTVSTGYSDIGLTANTLYMYAVSAIDGALNESAQSASSSATTFKAPVTPSSGSGGGSSQTRIPQISNLVVTPTQTGVTISWNTNIPTQGTISWGLTSSNEIGSVGELLFATSHSVSISGLLPGTQYSFGLTVVSGGGAQNSIAPQTFTTLMALEGAQNARNFTATADTNQILLKWRNPQSDQFDEVRIVRNTGFYPTDETDGEVIYEGSDEVFPDTNVTAGVRYYYALFTKDRNGSYSSGLLASARILLPGDTSSGDDILGTLPQSPDINPIIKSLSFLDFDFIQNGKKINKTANGYNVLIDGNQNLTVSLDYRKVPEVLKSIAVTLKHPSDPSKTFSFLLRVNKEKTAYVATLGALGDSGNYGVHITIVDYKNRGMKNIFGNLLASANIALDGKNSFFLALIVFITENFFYLLLLAILLVVIWSIKKGHSNNVPSHI